MPSYTIEIRRCRINANETAFHSISNNKEVSNT